MAMESKREAMFIPLRTRTAVVRFVVVGVVALLSMQGTAAAPISIPVANPSFEDPDVRTLSTIQGGQWGVACIHPGAGGRLTILRPSQSCRPKADPASSGAFLLPSTL